MSSLPSSRRQFLQRLSLATGALLASPLLTRTASGQEAAQATGSSLAAQYGPYLQNPSDTEMAIVWTAEKPGLSWVEYWPVNDPGSRKVAQDSSFGIRHLKNPDHVVTIKGLEPGKKYAYKIYSRAKDGRKPDVIVPEKGAKDQDGTFTTLNSAADACSIFIVNDMHGRGEYMAELMKKGEADKKDIIFHNGDIADWISKENQIEETILKPAAEYVSKVPFVFIRGNHEYRGSMPLSVTKTFPPRNGQYYYLLRQGPVCFIVLDTGEDKADDRNELFGLTDWVPYFEEQGEWLKTAVEDPLFKNAPFRVVLQHIPYTPPRGDRVNYTGELIKEKFLPPMVKGKVDILICAHTHRNMFMEGSEDKPHNFPILVNDNKGYLTINAAKSEMTVEHFDKDGQRIREVKFSRGS